MGCLFLLLLLLLTCISCILETKASFANIFSQSVGCLFILFMVSFAVQQLEEVPFVHFLIFLNNFIYLLLAMLGLCCCTDFSLVAASSGYCLVAVRRLLIAVTSLVAEHGL